MASHRSTRQTGSTRCSGFAYTVNPLYDPLTELKRRDPARQHFIVDGADLEDLGTLEGATEALRIATGLTNGATIEQLVEEIAGRLRGGEAFVFTAVGMRPNAMLLRIVRELKRAGNLAGNSCRNGALLAEIALLEYPSDPRLAPLLQRWLKLPTPIRPEFEGYEVAPEATQAIGQLLGETNLLNEHMAETVQRRADDDKTRAITKRHVDEAALEVVQTNAYLDWAAQAASALPRTALDTLVRYRLDQPISPSATITAEMLRGLANRGIVRPEEDSRYRWTAELLRRVVCRARARFYVHGQVLVWTGGPATIEDPGPIRSLVVGGAYELAVRQAEGEVYVGATRSKHIHGHNRSFRLLDYLLTRAREGDDVVSFEDLDRDVWDSKYVSDQNRIHRVASSLRKQLNGTWDRLVKPASGYGYRIDPDPTLRFIHVAPT
jgi:hypothetical protein